MSAGFCGQCGAPASNSDQFCTTCGTSIMRSADIDANAGRASAPKVSDRTSGAALRLFRYARRAKIVALVGFVLPWATVSCSGQPVVELSGLNMALGFASFHNPLTGATTTQSGQPNIAILAGLLIIVATLLFAKPGPGRRSGADLVCSILAAFCIIFGGFMSLGEAQRQAQATGLQIMPRFGFWISAAGLLATTVVLWKQLQLNARASSRSEIESVN